MAGGGSAPGGHGRKVRQRRREDVAATVARVQAECDAAAISEAVSRDLEQSRAASSGLGRPRAVSDRRRRSSRWWTFSARS